MRIIKNPLRAICLGLALLAASGPAIDGLGITAQPIDAAFAFKKLGGADKIGWARKFRAWCKDHEGNGQCSYVNSLKVPKCVNSDVKNFKGACPAKR
jgi:hypothetical protein